MSATYLDSLWLFLDVHHAFWGALVPGVTHGLGSLRGRQMAEVRIPFQSKGPYPMLLDEVFEEPLN